MQKTFHIHIRGQVQGVGFRPFVYKLAVKRGLKGWVNNTSDGVHIEITATEAQATAFYEKLLTTIPVLAIVTGHEMEETGFQNFEDFQIIHTETEGTPNLLLTPDYGMCEDCRREIYDKTNHRYRYPFITCTNCGPRYSIIRSLPYDRDKTTMDPFCMCPVCQKEYDDPLDRRYYSQTNSCPDCAVKLSMLNDDRRLTQEEILTEITNGILAGKIIALKGIGGFLLIADACNPETIRILRKRKHRPTKPFALMYRDLAQLKLDAIVMGQEATAFNSIYSPIVLFRLKKSPETGIQNELIAPGLHQIGAMRPYTPLYELILSSVGKPIIATSGNISNSPIIYDDEKASRELASVADIIVGNNREIVVPQDDSIIKFSPHNGQKIIIRRSRGYAPTFIHPNHNIPPEKTVLAMGAGLKSSFAYVHRRNVYISQYLGNLNSYETQMTYNHVMNHFFSVFQSRPDFIIHDKHPQYHSTMKGIEMATNNNLPVKAVQHHKAHFYAVLAENGLLSKREKVLGVIWDGVGLGDDAQIWGGEFLDFSHGKMTRLTHFAYFRHLSFDKFAMEPRLPAISLVHGLEEGEDLVREKFTDTEWRIYKGQLSRTGGLMTSSMGRIFDAVASLLGIKDYNTFEGEAAMLLEDLALQCEEYLDIAASYYTDDLTSGETIPVRKIITAIIRDLKNGVPKEVIALKFHITLALIIIKVARQYNYPKIAFSGGVFQNGLLVDLIIHLLGQKVHLYFHRELSPNDENISFGQLAAYELCL